MDETTSNNNFGPQFHKTFKTQTSKAWARIEKRVERKRGGNQPTNQPTINREPQISVKKMGYYTLIKDKKRAHILGLK